jgi:signal transduction histidine kinase
MTISTPPDAMIGPQRTDTIRRERTLVEAELVSSVAWLIRLRWIAGVGVILATWLVGVLFNLQTADAALYVIGAAILVYNLVFYLIERRLTRNTAPATAFESLAKWQVGLDWVAMALLIHFSGGIESPVILFFYFHIIIVSILFKQRIALAFAVLAVVILTGIAMLEYWDLLPHAPVSGFLPVPLYQNGLYVGAMLFFFACTGLIAAYLGSSINERLRRREQEVVELTESLQRATARLEALNEGARTVGSTLDLPQVLNRLVESTAQAMNVRACSIRLLNASGHRLEPVAVTGLSQIYLQKGPVDPEFNPLAREVLSGKVVNIPNAPSSSLLQYPEEARQEGIQSMLSAPLIGKEGPLGIIRAYAVEPARFTAEDEAFLAAIAGQGSIAIENAIAYQAIEALDATKTQFIRTVTHELRSPVSVTQSLLRTLATGYAGQVTEQQQDILNRAARRVDFLQKLIDDLLDLAAGKADLKTHEERQPVSLTTAVERVVKRYEVSAQEKNLTLELKNRVKDEALNVLATSEGLDLAFNNLVSNAVKYTPRGGRVTVTLARVDHEAQVGVEDTGIGIPEDAIQHLFEEFYRAPNARELEHEGTGLGLTIVKDLISRFGGRVAVQSTENVGTRFTVSLPLLVTHSQGQHAQAPSESLELAKQERG